MTAYVNIFRKLIILSSLISASSAYLILKLGGQRLKDGGAYLKVKEIIPMKFQNILVFFLQTTINNDHYGI